MKKKFFIIFLTLLVILSSSCVNSRIVHMPENTSASEDAASEFSEKTTEAAATEPSENESDAAQTDVSAENTESVSETVPTQTSAAAPETDICEETENSSESAEGRIPEASSVGSETTVSEAPATEPVPATEDVVMTVSELPVNLPDANGKMVVDKSPDNKFTAAVIKARGCDAALLAAVYSVPESGQNYVFEFRDKTSREKSDLRRVYLLDNTCRILSVAAASAEEKEKINATENWFCFNVLIKGVIFDAIADELRP